MNIQEVAKILLMIAAVDDRVDPDQPRVAMWHETLLPDMPFDFARQWIVEFYRDSRLVAMPADLNQAWRNQRVKARNELLRQAELEAANQAADIPESFKKLAKSLKSGLNRD